MSTAMIALDAWPGWEPNLCGAERHTDTGELYRVFPARPWAAVWWDGDDETWHWAVWPRQRRKGQAGLIDMEQRRLGVGTAAQPDQALEYGHGRDVTEALELADEALWRHP